MSKKLEIKIPTKNPIERGHLALCYISSLVYFSTTTDFSLLEDDEGTIADFETMRDLIGAFVTECGSCFDEINTTLIAVVKCSKCQNETPVKGNFCGSCGNKIDNKSAKTEVKDV